LKKVLIITYYWPPSGGAGVMRWLKLVKYLRGFGWEPVVYTPENSEAPAIDPSLEKDIPKDLTIIKTKIWEPYAVYKRFVGRKKEDSIKVGFLSEKKNPSLTEKISVWIRGNFFIPDARKYWIRPSVKFLVDYLSKNPVDAIISTGPPHSMHMIALGIKEKLNIPWMADFRDPWTKIDFYDKLMLTKQSDKAHMKMEQQVLKLANKIVTVSGFWAKDFEKLSGKKVEVVTNGFDPDDFKTLKYKRGDKFELVHLGSMNKDRNPVILWKALSEFCLEDDRFESKLKITFIGQTDYSVFESLKEFNLSGHAEKIDYLPHQQAMELAANASVLLLPLNNTPNVDGIIPGKLFEYLALQRPILCIGPEGGDSAKIILDCKAGIIAGFEDMAGIKSSINKLYGEFISDDAIKVSQQANIDQHSRKKLAGDIASLLNEIVRN
jgi:glycosyltransferase involved in cell wall biosynthesis